jgi:predicted metal-dependent hydrolase
LSGALQEEDLLQADPRLQQAIDQFDDGDWYACHDGLEELWHETQGPMRPVLQGLLQIAVAHLHLERGNRRGATVLMGEGLGRLAGCGEEALGLRLSPLREGVAARLSALQAGGDPSQLPPPRLERAPGQRR